MAKVEYEANGDFDFFLDRIVQGILNGSATASLEEESDFSDGTVRCSIRIFERFSAFGGNRLSLTVVLFQLESGRIHISAAATGGSQAMFFKVNTWGEESFLACFQEIMEGLLND